MNIVGVDQQKKVFFNVLVEPVDHSRTNDVETLPIEDLVMSEALIDTEVGPHESAQVSR